MRARFATFFVVLSLLVLAGCSRGPDPDALEKDVTARLAQALPDGPVTVAAFRRLGSQSDTKAPAGESRRIIYFDVDLKLARDFDFGAWDSPGVAGIVLTIGMAVDANVLINERIREELRAGRTVRSAIEAGYQNALPAILDSNVTTFLSGVILFQFGTGPIKGFAVTLCVGILTTVITAVYLTRTYYDLRISARKLERISI